MVKTICRLYLISVRQRAMVKDIHKCKSLICTLLITQPSKRNIKTRNIMIFCTILRLPRPCTYTLGCAAGGRTWGWFRLPLGGPVDTYPWPRWLPLASLPCAVYSCHPRYSWIFFFTKKPLTAFQFHKTIFENPSKI